MFTRARDCTVRDLMVAPPLSVARPVVQRHWRLLVLAAALMLTLAIAPTQAEAQAPPTSQTRLAPAATSWLSATTGFVLGEGDCPPMQSGCTSILMTRDGGRTFTRWPGPPVPVATRDPAAALAVSHVLFVSLQVGYAWGPGLWMTTDGARHWRSLPPTNVIAVLPAVHAVDVLALSCPPTAAHCAAPEMNVWRASTGRTTLVLVTRLVGGGLWEAAQSGQIGVIALASVPTAGPNRLWRTNDGGASWSPGRQPCDRGSAGAPGAVAVSRDGSILVVCGEPPSASQQLKVLYASADGGTTFVDVGQAPLYGVIQEVAAYSRDTVAMTVFSGTDEIYVSGDGGLHYTTSTVAGGGAPLTSLAWTGPTSAVAVEGGPGLGGPDRLLESLDAGAHWATLPLVSATPPLRMTARAVWSGAVRIQAMAAAACLQGVTTAAGMPCLGRYLLAHGAPPDAVAYVVHDHAYLIGWRPGAISVGEELSLIPMDCGCRKLVLQAPSGSQATPVPQPGGSGWAALARWYRLPGGGTGLTLAGLNGSVESESASGTSVTLQYPLVNRCASCAVPYHLRVMVRLGAASALGPAVSLGPCLAPGLTAPPDPAVMRCPPVETWLG